MGKFLRSILVPVIAFFVVLAGFYVNNAVNMDRYVEHVKKMYVSAVEHYAESMSIGYFQWNTMYELLKEGRIEEVQAWLEDLKSNFELVEEVTVVPAEEKEFDLFSISSDGTKLVIDFKVFNEDLSDFVDGKFVRTVLNAQNFLEYLGDDHIRISSNGKTFVFGLKYRTDYSPLNLTSFLFATVVGFSAWLSIRTVKKLRHEERLRSFYEAILSITERFLMGKSAEKMYELILSKAIEVVPNAQAGTVLAKRENKWCYVAAVGYDLEKLSKVEFTDEDQMAWFEKPIKTSQDMLRFNRQVDDESMQTLLTDGKLREIKCSLTVPVYEGNEIALCLNLENFEREDAFNEENLRYAQLFANYLAMVLSKMKQDEKICQQQKLLEYLSSRDPLTGLMNRRAFEEYGERILSTAENKKVGVMFMDLDRFKIVNDVHGHNLGDRVLTIVGSRLSKVLRQNDAIARFGGDEFVALIQNCDEEELAKIAERLVKAVEELIQLDGTEVKISTSIGIAIFPKDAQELDQLIRLADVAMYYAKRKGLKVAFFSEISA